LVQEKFSHTPEGNRERFVKRQPGWGVLEDELPSEGWKNVGASIIR